MTQESDVDRRVLDELRGHLNNWRAWANAADGRPDSRLGPEGFSCIRSTMDAVTEGRIGLALERWNDLSSPDKPALSEEAEYWPGARVVIVPAPRPENDQEFSFQHPDHKGEFVECDSCRAKPGWPQLCRGCLHNREVIQELKTKLGSSPNGARI